MRIKYVILLLACNFIAPSLYAQYNYSPPEKYLKSQYSNTEFQQPLSSKNRLAEYMTTPQEGFVILLDSTQIVGQIELYGRCFNELYGVVINPDEVQSKRLKSNLILNKSSLLAFGLLDRSVNQTPDLFEWEELFTWVNNPGESRSSDDTTEYVHFAENTFGKTKVGEEKNVSYTDNAGNTAALKNVYTYKPKFYKHDCEVSKLSLGYAELTNGERVEGYIQLDRIDGLVVEVRISPTFKMKVDRRRSSIFVRDAPDYKRYKPKELKAYGVRESTVSKATRLNETPSAFTWGMKVPGVTTDSRSTKGVAGYLMLKDGTEMKGDLELKARNGEVVELSIKPEGGKRQTVSIDLVNSFGAAGAPKDNSINETTEAFNWQVKQSLTGQEDPAIQESSSKPGYVITADGNRIEGKISLVKEYGFVTEISIKRDKEKKEIFSPHQISLYGVSDSSPAGPTTMRSMYGQALQQQKLSQSKASGPDSGDEKTMRPSSNNPMQSSIVGLPLAVNTAVNESSEEYFEWVMGAGTPGKHTEKSIPKDGYVRLKDGKEVKGELQLKRLNTRESKYYLSEFEIKNATGKFTYTQEQVVAYGINLGGTKPLKPGDRVEGYVIASNPRLISTPTIAGGYQTEPKAGFVQLMSGEVYIGQVSERKTATGRVDITLKDVAGKETMYKGNLLAYGYIDIVPFNEFPPSVYITKTDDRTLSLLGGAVSISDGDGTKKEYATGYLRLLDNTVVVGKFGPGIPGVTQADDEAEEAVESGDPCAVLTVVEPPPTPPLNKFFDNIEAARREATTNSDLIDDVYYFSIKTKEGKKKFRFDEVKAFGAYNVFMGQLTKNGMLIHEDKKLNFYKGYLITNQDVKLDGWVAHIKSNNSQSPYYGVYYTPDVSTPVKVYAIDDLKEVKQNIVVMKSYDPEVTDFLEAKEMSSTFDAHENGTLVDKKGMKKSGNVSLEVPPKLWYATSLIYTSDKGVQEVYDKDNPVEYVEFSENGVTQKYIMYRGVFVKVIKEAGPLVYVRNPFPTIQTGSSKLLNNILDDVIQSAVDNAAESVTKSVAEKDLEAGLKAGEAIQKMDVAGAANIAMYIKEYLVYDILTKRSYLVIKRDLGRYTYSAELEDLANGCALYLSLDKKAVKELGEVNDYETGEGIMPTLEFLRQCYYPVK